jgi:hypothetical protein
VAGRPGAARTARRRPHTHPLAQQARTGSTGYSPGGLMRRVSCLFSARARADRGDAGH